MLLLIIIYNIKNRHKSGTYLTCWDSQRKNQHWCHFLFACVRFVTRWTNDKTWSSLLPRLRFVADDDVWLAASGRFYGGKSCGGKDHSFVEVCLRLSSQLFCQDVPYGGGGQRAHALHLLRSNVLPPSVQPRFWNYTDGTNCIPYSFMFKTSLLLHTWYFSA